MNTTVKVMSGAADSSSPGAGAKGGAARLTPFDVCYCGDYRHQHVDGVGACNLRELCFPAHCAIFRLSELHTKADQAARAAEVPDALSKALS